MGLEGYVQKVRLEGARSREGPARGLAQAYVPAPSHHPAHLRSAFLALAPSIPCPVCLRSGSAPCHHAAAAGLPRRSPSNPSEVPGSSSALSGQTGIKKMEREVLECSLLVPHLAPQHTEWAWIRGKGWTRTHRPWLCACWLSTLQPVGQPG